MVTLSILLGIAAIIIVVLIIIQKMLSNTILHMYFDMQELLFMDGEDIDEDMVLQSYEDVNLLFRVEPGVETIQIVDTSLYKKNNLIGLIYIVPKNTLKEIKNDDLLERIKEKIDIDIEDDYILDKVDDTIQGTLLPHRDILQLRTGKWVWR